LGTSIPLALGMRYGKPSLSEALAELSAAGVTHPVVLPLYPQYARATLGSTLARLKQLPPQTFSCIEGYAEDPGYIAALVASVHEHWGKHGRGQKLLISFHGIPKQAERKGDPYEDQCARTVQQLAAALHLNTDDWQLVFQSRFGRAEWLTPYTDETLRELAASGVKTVDVICPGFAADCLETLEEIALRYAGVFRQAGGKDLRYIPALNDRPDHIRALADLVMPHLSF
ncbi:MAG: ferrochelatase, partial [Gammaproteobacteria bacterium]